MRYPTGPISSARAAPNGPFDISGAVRRPKETIMTDTASRTLKLASWNVNGLRAVLKKNPSFTDIVAELDADVLGLQETKLQEGSGRARPSRLSPGVELR